MAKFLMTMKLTKQGDLKGSSTKKEGDLDYSKGMECHGFNHAVVTPIDPNSGALSGKRRHNPITIRKEVDAASPKLFQALVTNEVFKTAKLQFSKVGPNGKPAAALTIELTNGRIIDIKPAAGSGGKGCEDVTLAFDGQSVNGIPDGIIPYGGIIPYKI